MQEEWAGGCRMVGAAVGTGCGVLGLLQVSGAPSRVKPTPVGCPRKPVVLEAQDELLNGPGSPLALFF